jgi:hypothetical protein
VKSGGCALPRLLKAFITVNTGSTENGLLLD